MNRNKLILVVDYDREMRGMLSRLLELEGYDVAIAVDSTAALAQLEKHKPDLVLIDIVMPDSDGLHVLTLLRQRSKVPIIVVTARLEKGSICSALVLGADDYVGKPFHTRELLARIRAKLRRTWPKAAPSASIAPTVPGIEQRQQLSPAVIEEKHVIEELAGRIREPLTPSESIRKGGIK